MKTKNKKQMIVEAMKRNCVTRCSKNVPLIHQKQFQKNSSVETFPAFIFCHKKPVQFPAVADA